MLSYRDSFLRTLHGGSGALTLTMPEPEPVQHHRLPSGPEQILPQQLSQLPLPTRFDGANGPNQGCSIVPLGLGTRPASCSLSWCRHDSVVDY